MIDCMLVCWSDPGRSVRLDIGEWADAHIAAGVSPRPVYSAADIGRLARGYRDEVGRSLAEAAGAGGSFVFVHLPKI